MVSVLYYNTVETGSRIKTLRKNLGLTQTELSEQLNLSLRHLRYIEKGEKSASIDNLVEFAKFFHVTLDYLVLGISQEDAIDTAISLLQSLKRNGWFPKAALHEPLKVGSNPLK